MKKFFSLLLVAGLIFVISAKPTVVQAAPKNSNRYYGQDRFATSIAVARQLYKGQKVNNVVLASAYSFPDALAAGTLVGKLKAPIILVGSGYYDSIASLEFIDNHLVANGTITIVGGIGVVPQVIETYLLNKGFTVTRLGGSNRFNTDAKIVSQLGVAKGTPIVVADGYDFPDALGVSSIATSKGWPILLTGPNNLPQSVLDFVTSDQPTNIYLVGGEGVLHSSISNALSSAAPQAQIQRFGGQNRFETLSEILTKFYPNPSQIYLANGYDFADALSGSTLAAANNAPILLIDPRSKNLPGAVNDYLITLRNNGVTPQVNVLGGSASVPDRLWDDVNEILQSNGNENTTTPSAITVNN